jgi:ankyrin repeat protein
MELLIACEEGRLTSVQVLLKEGADVNATDPDYGGSCLHWASYYGHRRVAELLIEKGADVHARNKDGRTPLMLAAGRGQARTVKLLIAYGADVRAEGNDGKSALDWAQAGKHEKTANLIKSAAKELEQEKKQAAQPDSVKQSPRPEPKPKKSDAQPRPEELNRLLRHAAKTGDRETVKKLIDRGADPKVPDSNGHYPLALAVVNGHRKTAQVLIEAGADVDSGSPGMSPLMLATKTGAPRIVKMLLKAGADIEAVSPNGDTALIVAARKGHSDIAQILIDNMKSVDHKNAQGMTALMLFAAGSDAKAVKALLKKGADVSATDAAGRTALNFAAETGNKKTARMLLKAGADPNAKDSHAITPLALAAKGGHSGVVKLLEAHMKQDKQSKKTAAKPKQKPAEKKKAEEVSVVTDKPEQVEQTPPAVVTIGEETEPEPVKQASVQEPKAKDEKEKVAALPTVKKPVPVELSDKTRQKPDIEDPVSVLKKLSEMSVVKMVLSKPEEAQTGDAMLEKIVSDHPGFQAIVLINGKGEAVAASFSGLSGTKFNGYPTFVETMKGKPVREQPSKSDLVATFKPSSEGWTEIVGTPIDSQGKPVAALIAFLEHPLSERVARLIKAVEDGNTKTVKELVSDGVPVDVEGPDGKTPLAVAKARGNKEVLQLFRTEGTRKTKPRRASRPKEMKPAKPAGEHQDADSKTGVSAKLSGKSREPGVMSAPERAAGSQAGARKPETRKSSQSPGSQTK